MMITPEQGLAIIIMLWVCFGFVWFSIRDHERQVKKAVHRRRMRGKLYLIEGGKSNEQTKPKR